MIGKITGNEVKCTKALQGKRYERENLGTDYFHLNVNSKEKSKVIFEL